MQEQLKTSTYNTSKPEVKTITFFIRSRFFVLQGSWSWDLHSDAIYCSDVMSFPDDFVGTKGIVHPDDLNQLSEALDLMQDTELSGVEFRLITTYGEVKQVRGRQVSIAAPHPATEESTTDDAAPWERFLAEAEARKEAEHLLLRTRIAEASERIFGTASWFINKATGETWYSDNVYRIHGVPPQSLNPHANTFNAFIHPEDRVAVQEAFELAYAAEAPLHIEYRIVQPDGALRYVRQVTSWSFNNAGQLIFMGSLSDITELESLKNSLDAAGHQIQLLQQVSSFAEKQAGTGFWFMNLVTRKARFSENYVRIHGIKMPFVPSHHTFLQLVHPDDKERVQDIMERMLREHVLPETEYRIIRPDGRQRHLKMMGKLTIRSGSELAMMSIVQDITLLRNLENNMQETNSSLSLRAATTELAEQSAGICSAVWLGNGTMQWSDGFYRLLGYKPGSIEPALRFWQKAVHPADLKAFNDAVTLALNQQPVENIGFRLISRLGIRHLKLSFRQLTQQGQEHVIAVVQDITDLMLLKEQEKGRELYTALLEDYSQDLVMLTNKDNVITTWNAEAETRTGIKKSEALNQNLFDIFPALNDNNYITQLNTALKGKEVLVDRVKNAYLAHAHQYQLVPFSNEQDESKGVLHVVRDISKELQLQQQLAERLAFIENLLNATVDRIVVLDQQMNYLYWNPKAEEYYAIRKEQVLGKNILEIFPAFRNDPSYQEFRKALKGETVHLPAQFTEDATNYFETYLIPIKDEDGDVNAVLWIVHDLGKQLELQKEREQNLQLLQEQHRRLEEAQSIGHVGSFTWMVGSTITHWSDELYRINGLEPQSEVITLDKVDQFIHPEDLAGLQGIKEQSTNTPGNYRIVHRIVRRTGETRWVNHEWESVANESGMVERVTGIVQDITEEVAVQQRMQKSEALLRSTEAAAFTGSYEADLLENTFYFSDGMYRLFGEAPGSFTPSLEWIDSRSHPDDVLPVKEILEKAIAVKQPYQYTRRIYRKDGELRTLEAQGNVVCDAAGNAMKLIGLVQDITERSKAKQELLRLKEAMAQRATDKYYSIFNSIGEGFCIIELINDEGGTAVDYRYLEANPAFVHQSGLPDPTGRLASELIPQTEPYWLQNYERAAKTGMPIRFENWHAPTGRWYNTYAARIGDESSRQVAILFSDITERKQAEEALQQSEEQQRRFNELLEHQVAQRTKDLERNFVLLQHAEELAQIGSWEYDIQTGHMSWSEGMYQLFGLPPSTPVGPETYLDFAVPEDQPLAQSIIRHLQGKEAFETTLRIEKEAGIKVVKCKGSPIRNAAGVVEKIIGTDIDLTGIRAAEDKIKASESLLRQTTLSSPDAITIFNLQSRKSVYLNNCLASWVGLTNEQLQAMSFEQRLQLIHPEDLDKLLAFNENLRQAAGDDLLTLEYRILTRSGKPIWIRNRSRLLSRDKQGNALEVLSVLQDITREVELRQELQERTQYAESLIDASVDRICVYDTQFNILAWNKRFEELVGVPRQAALGKSLKDLFPRLFDKESLSQAMTEALTGKFLHLPPQQGAYATGYFERFYVPLQDARGFTYAVLMILHDVTEAVERQEQLKEANQMLAEKNRKLEAMNQELSNFTFIASHDLREPLRKIHMFSNFLLDKEMSRLSDTGKIFVEKTAATAKRLDTLIDDILTLAKVQHAAGKKQLVPLSQVLDQVKSDLSERVEASGALIENTPLPQVHCFPGQLYHLLLNLVQNALKFQPTGQRPEVHIDTTTVSGTSLEHLGASATSSYTRLSVRDNGIGFNPSYAHKIFHIFQRLHGLQEYPGTGIGLAICKKIMDNHGGFIEAHSEPGKGATFYCYFPEEVVG